MKKFIQKIEENIQTHNPVVMAFGRMNPPTTGHEKLVNKVKEIAHDYGAPHHVIISHSVDAKKNPLDVASKMKHAQRFFPGTNIVSSSKEHPTFLQHAARLHAMGHDHLIMVAGSDRIPEYEKKLQQYNGTAKGSLYNFKKIEVKSAGQRDPDAEGAEGMSASKMREHAQNNDFNSFKQGVPPHVPEKHAKELFRDVRSGMGIHESVNHGMFKAIFISGGPGSGKDIIIREAIANDEYSRRLPAIKRSKEKLLNSLQIAPTVSRLVRGHKLLNQTPIHLINLDRRADRLDGFMQRVSLTSGDRLASRIERFSAIDGQDLEMTPEIMHMFRGSDLPLRRSQTACALSHLSLWIELINSEHDHYIIFEDDVHFTSDFTSRLGELLGQILDRPQPDVIFLGLHYFDDAFSPKSSLQTLRSVVLENLMGGTFGYIISKSGAKQLFEIAQTEGIAFGIDTFILKNAHRVQLAEVVPNLVTSPVARHGGPVVDSDIQYEDPSIKD